MSAVNCTAPVRTAPRRARALPTCPIALLEAAHQADTERRTRAVSEFMRYQLAPGAVLVKRDGTGSYAPQCYAERAASSLPYFAGCKCPDCAKTITPLLDAMTAAGIGTALACKHHYMRLLLSGQPVRINNRVFRARLQLVAATVPTVPTMAA